MERNGKGQKKAMIERKKQAEHLFLTTDLSQGKIAEIVGVTEKTLSGWVNADAGAWKTSKAARTITKDRIVAQWYRQLYELNLLIESRGEGKQFATASEADTMSKIATQIDKLEKAYQFGTYYQIADELVEFINRRDANLAAQLALHVLDFVKSKSSVLNGK